MAGDPISLAVVLRFKRRHKLDTLNVLLNEVQRSDSYSIITIISIIKDIATTAAILIGIYFGHKGLKRYLLDDIVKEKISDLHRTNKQVAIVTKEVISEINSIEDLNRPLKNDDIKLLKKHTQKLFNISNGASKEVATFCFILNETIKDIKVSVKTKTYSEVRSAQDIYSLVYQTCIKINQFSSNIIDLPKRIKLEPYNEINKSVRKYIENEGIIKLKGVQFGISLNPKSSLSLLFSSIINRTTTGYIYKKRFFQLLGGNSPIIYELYINNIYFPVILKTNIDKPFMGRSPLHLVKFDMKQSIIPDDKKFTIEFFYSNINPTIKFMTALKLDDFIEQYHDAFLQDIVHLKKDSVKLNRLADETIKITCDKDIAEEFFKKVEKKFVKRIETIKKNS